MLGTAVRGAMAAIAVATISAACASKVTVVGDDSGPTKGAGASPGVTSSSSGAAPPITTSTASMVTTTTMVTTSTGFCDTGIPGDIGSPICDACITCSQTNECQFETTQCANNPDCVGYEQCRGACFDGCDVNMNNTIDANEEPCYSGSCHGDLDAYNNDPNYVPPPMSCLAIFGSGNQTGPSDYWGMLSCWICNACVINCNAAQNCQ